MSEAPNELKWIEEKGQSLPRPDIEEFSVVGGERSFKELILKKSRENMFVPLGLLATSACLTLGLFNMRRGESAKQQFYMRGRVAFQGFTLLAMTLGVYFAGKNSQQKKNEQQQQDGDHR